MVESLKWINDIVKLHYIKLVPSEEFVDDNDDNNLRYWKETGKRVLTKNIKNNLIFDNELEKKFLIELKLHLRRDFNERIIQIFGISQNPITNSFIFVIQYADGGNLRHVLENTNPSWIDKFSLAHQISDGLNFLHSKGLIHGNLYPRNIVFHQNRAKLTNFGILEHLITNFSTSSSYDELSIKNIPYVDPQLLLDETYKKDTRSDIYSFGVIMWEISSGFPPYKSVLQKNDLISNILKNKREIIIPNTPKVYSDLYTECWNNDPNKRLDINVLINQLNNSLNFMKSDLKSSGQISEQDKELKELEIDALAAELWLDMGEKKEVIPEIKVKEDINVESSSEIITEIPFENKEVKSREVRIITNESELSRKLSNKKKSWTSKAKSKAKGFVKRFSGSTSGSEMNTSNIRKSSTKSMSMDSKEIIGQREQLETGWTLVSSGKSFDLFDLFF
ncbi:kinase-like domain-containing protein [Glomus cerebriforme]|uniref:Kinase-like domain-containing protein n=1 Tax=Glomus cerebriforme TaxID=658196 RepID=A0A397SRK8_9GLOM|nr:kinase-like domain-containing protein [Glomus cerebriforme]